MLKGIKVEFVGEAQIDPKVIRRVLQRDLKVLFISPEKLLNNKNSGPCCLRWNIKKGFLLWLLMKHIALKHG